MARPHERYINLASFDVTDKDILGEPGRTGMIERSPSNGIYLAFYAQMSKEQRDLVLARVSSYICSAASAVFKRAMKDQAEDLLSEAGLI